MSSVTLNSLSSIDLIISPNFMNNLLLYTTEDSLRCNPSNFYSMYYGIWTQIPGIGEYYGNDLCYM